MLVWNLIPDHLPPPTKDGIVWEKPESICGGSCLMHMMVCCTLTGIPEKGGHNFTPHSNNYYL